MSVMAILQHLTREQVDKALAYTLAPGQRQDHPLPLQLL
jgi:hypothetical protein